MLYLLASCIALLIGPLLYRFFSNDHALQKILDGFIFVSLGGLVLIHILPELLVHGGFLAIIFVILGMWGPTASEKIFHQYSKVTHNLTLSLGIAGLLLHTITDGGALIIAQQEHSSILLALGIILHRLPVGLAIWWLLRPQLGQRWALLVLMAMMLLTAMGYFAGEQWLTHLSLDNTVYLQAFVTGSILHVVLHQPHNHQTEHQHSHTDDSHDYFAGIGSLLGIGLLIILMVMDSGGHEHHHHEHTTEHLYDWMLTIAPVLLLSYGAACLRFRWGITPHCSQLSLRWLQRLAGPEALIITGLLLGPIIALLQLIGLAVIGAILTLFKIEPTDPHPQLNCTPLKFGFMHLVDRSAPWIILSLILANLIGHPSIPLNEPYLQIGILLLLFLPMRFCNLGGAVLSLSLAYSGWSMPAILLPLIAAPIFNISQLALMSFKQKSVLISIILLFCLSVNQLSLQWKTLLQLPESISFSALIVIALLFSACLLRLGPRQFIKRIWLPKINKHSH